MLSKPNESSFTTVLDTKNMLVAIVETPIKTPFYHEIAMSNSYHVLVTIKNVELDL